ncbi:DHH phosphoesterase [Fistulina hepatica ATCC 64428]|uniref:DHH phosphoesterase n=1 Tax=Fistulina hepatica ATCC 64428 TaxID=1128425 RepID=A0A0D7AG09_9AGAR|nr:DHH phosphoesterase [Fistulina hepatica ATCC 64428]
MPSPILEEFVSRTKERFLADVQASKGREWTVVMGNEAGDIDSVACAIAFAWRAHSMDKAARVVPLVQIERDDYDLRPENDVALQLSGFTDAKKELLTLTDVAHMVPFPSATFALVDHNRLLDRYASADARVVAIVDHHEDENQHTDADPRIISPSGSCSSHMAMLCAKHMPRELATLLLTAIITDTGGLKPHGKATDVDREAAYFLFHGSNLNENLEIGGLAVSTSDIHKVSAISDTANILLTVKSDVRSFSIWDLLRRDYKEYSYSLSSLQQDIRVGIATVPMRLKDWARGNLAVEADKYMARRGLTVLGVLTTFRSVKKNKHKRQQVWVVRSSDDGVSKDAARTIMEQLKVGLEASKDLDLNAYDLPHHNNRLAQLGFRPPDKNALVYEQGNAHATRKVVAPLVKAIFSNI